MPPAPPAAVFDDEVLPERLVELLHQDARDAVDRAAGRERHDDGDGARWIGVRRSRMREANPNSGDAQRGNELKMSHVGSSQRLQLEGSWVASAVDH